MKNYRKIFDLTGQRILITGAGRLNGIGATLAKCLVDYGATVIIHDRNETEQMRSILCELKEINPHCAIAIEDLSVAGAGQKLIQSTEKQHGSLDIVITNHSLQVLGNFTDVTAEEMTRQININFCANVEILQTILPLMASRHKGKIINIGSVNQSSPKAIVSIYAAMKAAQHNLIQSLAQAYAKQGVMLNTIVPGLIDTYPENRAGHEQDEKSWDDYASQLNWLGRAGLPSEITSAVLFLASPATTFMTGETINITGGY